MSAERDRVATFGRLENGLRQAGDWYHWGPYVSERQWGTVREDYSAGGDRVGVPARTTRPARAPTAGARTASPASRTSSSGSASALALWNGRDPILKERIFGLTGNEGNHGEDAKEYWWYLDALPSHAWNRWRYHYPQRAFPYADLVDENGRRGKRDPEYELLDTGRLRRRPLLDRRGRLCQGRPARSADDGAGDERGAGGRHGARAADGVVPEHVGVGRRRRDEAGTARGRRRARRHRASVPRRARTRRRRRRRRCCSATTRRTASGCTGRRRRAATPKDGINDHVVSGAATVAPEPGRRLPSGTGWGRARRDADDPRALAACRDARPTRGPTSTRSRRRGSPRRTSSTPG